MGEDSNALADIRLAVEVGLTAVNGRLDVIIERLEHQDRRADQHAEQLVGLDARLDTVERTAVTREDMAARQHSTLGWVTVIVTVIGIIVGAAVTLFT